MVDAADRIEGPTIDYESIVQSIIKNLNIAGGALAFRLRRSGPELYGILRHRSRPSGVCEDGLPSYFVKRLHVAKVHPLKHLSILTGCAYANRDVGVEI